MSRLSGVCDLYDHVSFEKMYRDYYEGSLPEAFQNRLFELLNVTIYAENEKFSVPTYIIKKLEDEFAGKGENWDEKVYDKINSAFGNCLYSDLLECFNIFKERTNGKIYQHKKVEVTEHNQENIAKQCNGLEIIEHKNIVEDKRTKSGTKEITTYTYSYYGKEYKTLKELNKKHVYIAVEITFNTLLDILPYLPYEISSCCSSDGQETVFIANKSAVEYKSDDRLHYFGQDNGVADHRKELADLYLQVCKNYFLYDLENRTKIVPIVDDKLHCESKLDGTVVSDYFFWVDDEIDYMHDIEFIWKDEKVHNHWTSPKLSEYNKSKQIIISKQDVECYLKEDITSGNLMIKYVAKPKNGFPRSNC